MVNFPSSNKFSAYATQKAAEQLKAGHLVAFPTETVYGLGADATNENAVRRIYEVKGRPTDHPLIVHVSSIRAMNIWAREIPDYAMELAHAFWPGPMTLILKRKDIAKDFITGGQDSIGIRVPSHPIALELMTRFEALGGVGIAAPSANRFGQVSPTSASDVHEELGLFFHSEDLILEGGRSDVGIESTIIDTTGSFPIVLRPGAVTRNDIKRIIGDIYNENSSAMATRASGMYLNHYAPKARVLVNVIALKGQGLFALDEVPTPEGVIRIASPLDVIEFAHNFYAALRAADQLKLKTVVVVPPNGEGLAEAILERILKAAAGRQMF